MEHRSYEERAQRAMLWSFAIGIGLTLLVGWWLDWPLAWYWMVLAAVVLSTACMSGWQKGAAQEAIQEMNERDRQRDDHSPGS